MNNINNIFSSAMEFFINIPWTDVGLYTLVVIATYILVIVIAGWILSKLRRLASRTKTRVDDFIVDILRIMQWPAMLMIVIAGYPVFFNGDAPVQTAQWMSGVVFTIGLIFVGVHFIDFSVDQYARNKFEHGDTPPGYIPFFTTVLKAGLWIVGILLILANLGYNVNSLVAGLGIGGIAIALALQNILGDIFSSLSIFLDKPFRVGDFIIFNNELGTVEKIGIRSTRIATLQGQQLVVPNQDLVKSYIHNYKRMKRRRANFQVRVSYETPHGKLQKISEIIKDVIKNTPDATLDRAHLKELGEFGFIYEAVYYVEFPDYAKYMDAQESINIRVMEQLAANDIKVAVPARTVYLYSQAEAREPSG